VLCDAVVAVEHATFATPFAALGVTPEGCSSVLFERRFGDAVAARMLDDGWCPTAREALAFGLVDEIVVDDEEDARDDGEAAAGESRALVAAARARARALADGGATRRFDSDGDVLDVDALRAVNASESRNVADSFFSAHFLDTMVARATAKGPKGAREVRLFGALRATHGVWSRFF